jgi:transcriptional regulator GlxA family with amidase domain
MSPHDTPKTVALLLFPDVEVLDFAGPFEVFSVAALSAEPAPFRVVTVAATTAPISAIGGLKVTPDHDLHSCPQADILLIPGGNGSRAAMRNDKILAWLKAQAAGAEIVASICTGALLLGKIGLLDGLRATTHWTAIEELRAVSNKIDVQPQTRFIDNGKVLTSAGISAGIDMSLYLVKRLCGDALADLVVREMEYDWRVKAAG